jgi:ribonucleoside-diphosphate reductase alpha chain
MKVLKRNGNYETVSFDKVTKRISNLCNDLNIDPIIIAQYVNSRIYDGISTSELDELTAEVCISKSTIKYDYAILAGRIIISNNHKNTSPSFSETIMLLYQNNPPLVSSSLYKVVMENKEKLNNIIDNNRDYDFDYFGFKTLEKAYLLKVNGKILERIQYLFLRVSLGLHGEDIKSVIKSYNGMSQKYFTHATPTLYHSGTNFNQLASCFLLGTQDTINGIYKTLSDCASISKHAGGIGLHISNIRSKGSIINSTGGKSTGIIPMLKVYNETAKYVNQGGRRPGSIAIYLEPSHPEILEFLELRKNHGAESQRARDLFLALMIPDNFMRAVENDGDWYLMDPYECPKLSDTYGEEYEELFNKYVEEKRYRKIIKAREIWKYIVNSQIETGTPYLLYKDAINKKSNQKHYGTIKSSNLCSEITLYSDEKEYAVCTLASIGLSKFVKSGVFNFEKLGEITQILVKNLNKVVDINYYPVPETRYSNMNHRPLGIGVQGLADVFMLMKMPYDSDEALELNKLIFETIYYNACVASHKIAQEEGPYEKFKGSPMSKGLFQFDLWGIEPTNRYNWDELRENIKKDGIRNSTLIALMPTASTSQILGNNECMEPITSNIYSRRTLAGDFVVVNKYLIQDLEELGLWNEDLKNLIIKHNGSVQKIDIIPKHLRDIYKTVWEIKQKVLVDMSVSRGPYVCQTQSLNLFFEEPTANILTSCAIYGWKKGLKTGNYYIRTRPKIQAQQFTIEPEKEPECVMCSA